VPADSASEIVKFTISIPRESCTNAKAKYSSSEVPPDPSVHFYHWLRNNIRANRHRDGEMQIDYTPMAVLCTPSDGDKIT